VATIDYVEKVGCHCHPLRQCPKPSRLDHALEAEEERLMEEKLVLLKCKSLSKAQASLLLLGANGLRCVIGIQATARANQLAGSINIEVSIPSPIIQYVVEPVAIPRNRIFQTSCDRHIHEDNK
jgi:hypothetical protein